MSPGKLMLGAVIAMGAGAVLGVLFAPEKGSVTRKKLVRQSSRYSGAVTTAAREYNENLNESIEHAKDLAVDITGKVKHVADILSGA